MATYFGNGTGSPITDANEQVSKIFELAVNYANSAEDKLKKFSDKLDNSFYQPPTISVEWNSITPPSIDWGANVPTMPEIEFQPPGDMPAPIDTTGLDILQTLHRNLQKRGAHLVLCGLNSQPGSIVFRSGFSDKLGDDNITANLTEALIRAQRLSGREPEISYT